MFLKYSNIHDIICSHLPWSISYLFVVITSAPEIVPFLSTSGDCPSYFYKFKYLLFAKKVFSFHILFLLCELSFYMQSIDKDIFGFLNYNISLRDTESIKKILINIFEGWTVNQYKNKEKLEKLFDSIEYRFYAWM